MPDTAARTTDKASARAASILGLCLPGDTLLYLLLPMQNEAFGVPLVEAGLRLLVAPTLQVYSLAAGCLAVSALACRERRILR